MLRNALELQRRYIPAATGKALCNNLLFPKLPRYRAHLLGRCRRSQLLSNLVHTGDMLIFIKRNNSGATSHLSCQCGLLIVVARKFQTVIVTPVIDILPE